MYISVCRTPKQSHMSKRKALISSGDDSSLNLTAFSIVTTDLRKKHGVKQVKICEEKVLPGFRGIMPTFNLNSSKC